MFQLFRYFSEPPDIPSVIQENIGITTGLILNFLSITLMVRCKPNNQKGGYFMQLSNTLIDGFDAVMSYLISTQQSEDSIKHYQSAYQKLSVFFEQEGKTAYDPVTNQAFRTAITKKADTGQISGRQYRRFIRMSTMIDDHYQGRPIQLRYSYGNRYKYKLSADNEMLLNRFVDWLTVAENSVAGFKTSIREFLFYLQENHIDALDSINMQTIADFLIQISGNHKASMNNMMVATRKFIVFLKEQSLCTCSPELLLSFKTAPTRRKVYPAFDTDDIRKLLSAPDRTTVMGIRDYAVLLLASCTGIRAIDIANLKTADIDHEAMVIRFVQHKTSRSNVMPIYRKVMEAIDAYTYIRPNADNPYLFQTVAAPYRKLNDISSVRNILVKYLKSTGVKTAPWDGKGFHAFRRGMGVWLLEGSYSPELIAQVLGHKDVRMLKHYLPLSTDSMKKCALDFELAPLKSEVYR